MNQKVDRLKIEKREVDHCRTLEKEIYEQLKFVFETT